jgi:MraZ protein
MFLGQYEHTIDDKNRLTLPARFREELGPDVVLTRGLDGCLDVYPGDAWRRLVEERLVPLDPFSREGRELKRYFFALGADAEVDRQGRVHVPAGLVQHAGLGRDVVVAGVHDHVEIWDRGSWSQHVRDVEGSADDVAERLAQKRL